MKEVLLSIRAATPADVAALVPLVNGAYRGEAGRSGWTSEATLVEGPRTSEERLRDVLARPGSVVLVADRDGALLGCVHLQRGAVPGECEVGMLSVRVAEQANGVGRALLAAAESYARDAMGLRVLVLHVISVRAELLAWYERRGYQRTGRLVPFVPAPAGSRPLGGSLFFERLEKRVLPA